MMREYMLTTQFVQMKLVYLWMIATTVLAKVFVVKNDDDANYSWQWPVYIVHMISEYLRLQ